MILDSLNHLNWAAVAASLVAAFAIGAIWFSRRFSAASGRARSRATPAVAEADITAAASRPEALAEWLAGFAVAAVAMALSAKAVGANSVGDGIVLGLVLAVGLAGTSSSWPPVFARMPWAWWLVNNGAFLLMLAAMGAILGASR